MKTLILEPHNDDVALFAAFLAHRAGEGEAHIVTCLSSAVQGENADVRAEESRLAAQFLGCTHMQWWMDDGSPLGYIEREVGALLGAIRGDYDRVICPAYHVDGHDHHNAVAEAAVLHWPAAARVSYTTYSRTGGREKGTEVTPTADEIRAKLLALAVFKSQHAIENVRPWFLDGIREWTTP